MEPNWTTVANFGLPGLMLMFAWLIAKTWIASSERVAMEKVKVEDKKADAVVSAMTSLSGKIDSHHTADIQSHTALAVGIGELRGKLDEVLDRGHTPVGGVPTVDERRSSEYGLPRRPSTRNDR